MGIGFDHLPYVVDHLIHISPLLNSPLIFLFVIVSLQEFIEQFRVLLPKNAAASKEDISALLEKKMGLDPTTYQIGKTKVHH